ncbi:MspA family porin [Gordonia aichiensis]|uniref:MspA family protein n=1 Tax=Gordonia aichiensis NBRC 108223 TaxID=1220583 RepID=L7KMK1_9ACTN|nr:MspA family porin [Gordonia aichiensis]GAC48923.1 hypothetical protein GOACH_07_02090 [Gordonia aichiensis NBRC 108223]
MSKFSKLGRRGAAAAAVAAAAVIGATSMGAGHAEAGALANGYKQSSGINAGETVQIWRKGESANAVPTVANNPASRAAVTSGTYIAKLGSGLSGNISLNYIVGCQVNIDGLSLGLTGGFDISPSISASGSISLPLSPGQVAVVSAFDKDIKAGGSSTLQATGIQVALPNCGGYASARSAVKVVAGNGYNTDKGTVNGSGTYLQSTLYGQPFSLN